MQPDTTKACSFDDIANETTEMKLYIKMACQLGLMGRDSNGSGTIQKSTFDPLGVVERAQFGTILSRTLRGNTYDG